MFNASEEIYQTVKMTPLNPSPCCKASFALNFYLPEFWCNWLFVNNAAMKLDSAGSGEWALDLLYLLSVLGIWHISTCLLGGPVIELFDLCPLSLTVVDTEPAPLS